MIKAGEISAPVPKGWIQWCDKPKYICCGPTDMRKSINGLTIMVSESFSLDPFSESLFVFCNKARNRIKILEWDGDGFWLFSRDYSAVTFVGRFSMMKTEHDLVSTVSQ